MSASAFHHRNKTNVKPILRFVLTLLLGYQGLAADHADKPNILLIVADGMAFSDAACYGGDIATPHLDALAADGLRFTQFYNTARCWPSKRNLPE